LTPAALPAACQSAANSCAQSSCCRPYDAANTGPSAAINCCQAFASANETWFASPDGSQALVSSLTELAPPRIIHSFYEQQIKVRNLLQIHQSIPSQIDPLQKTTELLI